MPDAIEGLSPKRPFVRAELDEVADHQGVHVVWGPKGEALYVGMSGQTRTRLRQHLVGDRQASILHQKVGRRMDSEGGRASAAEIEEWLGQCTFQVGFTADPAAKKKAIMQELQPSLNDLEPSTGSNDDGTPDLAWLLQNVMSTIRRRERGGNTASGYRAAVTSELPRALKPLLPSGHVVKGSVGYGSPADVPWVSVLRSTGETVREGVYLVYLFAADGSSVYLALVQGVSKVQGGGTVLRKRSLDLRDAIDPDPDWTASIDLKSSLPLPKRYEWATAYAVRYDSGSVPPTSALQNDLTKLLDALTTVEDAGLADLSSIEPVHLVMKWSKELKSDTITLHRQIADERGSVWWGKFGSPGTSAMAAARLDVLRKQLAAEVPTFCFLYRSGELWKTRLLSVTPDASEVDVSRLPSYYSTGDSVLFLELADFEEVHPPSWALSNLLLSTDPDPHKTKGALGNQTSPVFVYIKGQSAREKGPTSATQQNAVQDEPTLEVEVPPLDIDWLVAETLCDRPWLEELVETLQRRPQIVLAGPPGTGKTWIAKALARFITQDAPLASRVVQLHASYGYEEFMEGLRPGSSEGGGIEFARVDGVVLRMVDQIEDGDDQQHVLVLDEMNRANLPRVFGELMYLLEYREQPVDLLYTRDFALPANLLFIGTMNTADRSIRSIDLALRRRFEVFECAPDANILERFYGTARIEGIDSAALIAGFKKLNSRLEELLDRHHTVGHSFFMADPMTPKLLRSVWSRQLLPLFEEYFFDNPDVAASLTLEEFWPDAASSDAD